MKIRKSFLSKSIQDAASSLFLLFIIPVVFYYEIECVLYQLHGHSIIYLINLTLGSFILFNIIANLLHMILIDTSIYATDQLMTVERFKTDEEAKEWHFCEKCELIVPPRSWHCTTCKVCILKRDHHCMFASNCIGLYNHRYFIAFLIYFFIGTTYCFFYNSYYIWIEHADFYLNMMTPVKMLFPMFMILFSATDATLFLYMLILIGSVFSGVLLIYHGRLIVRNATTHEKNKGAYDMGMIRNLKIVFGEKPLNSLLWPFTKSEISESYWSPAESEKSK